MPIAANQDDKVIGNGKIPYANHLYHLTQSNIIISIHILTQSPIVRIIILITPVLKESKSVSGMAKWHKCV